MLLSSIFFWFLAYSLLGDYMEQSMSVSNHEVNILDRKEIFLSGIKKILKLDTHDGKVRIKGHIDSFSYLEGGKVKAKEESFIAKLFK